MGRPFRLEPHKCVLAQKSVAILRWKMRKIWTKDVAVNSQTVTSQPQLCASFSHHHIFQKLNLFALADDFIPLFAICHCYPWLLGANFQFFDCGLYTVPKPQDDIVLLSTSLWRFGALGLPGCLFAMLEEEC